MVLPYPVQNWLGSINYAPFQPLGTRHLECHEKQPLAHSVICHDALITASNTTYPATPHSLWRIGYCFWNSLRTQRCRQGQRFLRRPHHFLHQTFYHHRHDIRSFPDPIRGVVLQEARCRHRFQKWQRLDWRCGKSSFVSPRLRCKPQGNLRVLYGSATLEYLNLIIKNVFPKGHRMISSG